MASCYKAAGGRKVLVLAARNGPYVEMSASPRQVAALPFLSRFRSAACGSATSSTRSTPRAWAISYNTLAAVQSGAPQTFRSGPHPEEKREAFLGRLSALSRVHELLSRSYWAGVCMRHLATSRLAADHDVDPARLEAVGPKVWLRPGAAVVFGTALHEPAANAVAHGALSSPSGRVQPAWSVGPDRAIGRRDDLWSEEGGPVLPNSPVLCGSGSSLIERGLAQELQPAGSAAPRSPERKGRPCAGSATRAGCASPSERRQCRTQATSGRRPSRPSGRSLPVILPHIRAHALAALALAARTRSPSLPDLPTTGEAGFPKLLAENWYCMVAPPQLPAAIRDRLSAATEAAAGSAPVRDALAARGAEAAWTSPQKFAALVQEGSAVWRQVAQSAGIKAE